MATIRETAMTYEPSLTKSISELDKVDVNMDLNEEQTCKDKEGKEFKIQTTTIDGEEYKVPKKVLAQLKEHLAVHPEMKYFKVIKKGEGLGTTYTVIPLKDQ